MTGTELQADVSSAAGPQHLNICSASEQLVNTVGTDGRGSSSGRKQRIMAESKLDTWDVIAVVCYFIAVLAIGLYVSEDFNFHYYFEPTASPRLRESSPPS